MSPFRLPGVKITWTPSTPTPRQASARRAITIVHVVLLAPITLLLAVVTLLLLAGLATDPSGFTAQIPAILVGLAMTVAGSLVIYRKLRRLAARD